MAAATAAAKGKAEAAAEVELEALRQQLSQAKKRSRASEEEEEKAEEEPPASKRHAPSRRSTRTAMAGRNCWARRQRAGTWRAATAASAIYTYDAGELFEHHEETSPKTMFQK